MKYQLEIKLIPDTIPPTIKAVGFLEVLFMKKLKALDGYIRVNVPVRLIVTEDELKKYDCGNQEAQNTIYCLATQQMVDNLDISDNDEPEFDDDRTITLDKAMNLINEWGYEASPDAMNILDKGADE